MTSRYLGGTYLAPIPVVSNTYTYYPWDGANQLGRLSNLKADKLSSPSSNLQNLSYSYDAVGNISQINDSNTMIEQDFSYDRLSRLTYWDTIISFPPVLLDSEGYTYDSADGNLSSKKGVGLHV